jgi:hypothetical protein
MSSDMSLARSLHSDRSTRPILLSHVRISPLIIGDAGTTIITEDEEKLSKLPQALCQPQTISYVEIFGCPTAPSYNNPFLILLHFLIRVIKFVIREATCVNEL